MVNLKLKTRNPKVAARPAKHFKLQVSSFKFASGFTLMEIVVAMLIFSLASVLIAAIFVNLQKAQQRIRDAQVAATDARYMLDVLAREIHADAIDYASLCGSVNCVLPSPVTSTNTLYLKTSQGKSLRFQLEPNCTSGNTQVGCVAIVRDNVLPSIPISSPNIAIDSLQFYVTPYSDPFGSSVSPCAGPTSSNCTPDVQPQVTIVMSTTSLAPHPEDRISLYLQTTVTSRTYER